MTYTDIAGYIITLAQCVSQKFSLHNTMPTYTNYTFIP